MCVEITSPSPPELGLGLSLAPPSTPAFDGNLELCCKIVSFSIPAIPLFPPGILNASVMLSLSPVMAAAQAYLDGLPPVCPLE